ncbi:hypothetical protein [Candidatus Laterigemmans baculatus]|uniref:hypothetical protein n=2 Tax=Candidatus Laterigemmans baculatus TaxID=2770505 RepID=UPI0013D9485E|nr:hypothetical protein [Candidatus Laterigemmans baculatus]
MWSMGDTFRQAFPENDGLLHEVEADDGICLWCYELPDGGGDGKAHQAATAEETPAG